MDLGQNSLIHVYGKKKSTSVNIIFLKVSLQYYSVYTDGATS